MPIFVHLCVACVLKASFLFYCHLSSRVGGSLSSFARTQSLWRWRCSCTSFTHVPLRPVYALSFTRVCRFKHTRDYVIKAIAIGVAGSAMASCDSSVGRYGRSCARLRHRRGAKSLLAEQIKRQYCLIYKILHAMPSTKLRCIYRSSVLNMHQL